MKVSIKFKTESNFVSGMVYEIESDNEYLIDELIRLTKIRYNELKDEGRNPSFPLMFECALRSLEIEYSFDSKNALVYSIDL